MAHTEDTNADAPAFTGSGIDTTEALAELPVDVGHPNPNTRAQGDLSRAGAAFDPASQMTAQARQGVRRDADKEQAKGIPGGADSDAGGGSVAARAAQEVKDEVGYLEGLTGTVGAPSRGI